MSSFGNAGTRTVRVYIPAVTVKFGQGEHLFYKLRVVGAEARFGFTCKDRDELLTHEDFPEHPTDVYQWALGVGKDCDPDSNDDVYALGMMFNTADKYTLEVEHRGEDDSVIQLLNDVDYESQDSADKYVEAHDVFS